MAAYAMCPRESPQTLTLVDSPAIESRIGERQPAKKTTPPKPRKWLPVDWNATEDKTPRGVTSSTAAGCATVGEDSKPADTQGQNPIDKPDQGISRPNSDRGGKNRYNQTKWNQNRSAKGQSAHIQPNQLQATQVQAGQQQSAQDQGKPGQPQWKPRNRTNMTAVAGPGQGSVPPHLRKQNPAQYIPPHLRKRSGGPVQEAPAISNGATLDKGSTEASPKPKPFANGGRSRDSYAAKASKTPDKSTAAAQDVKPPAYNWAGEAEPNWANSVICPSRPKANNRPSALPSPPDSSHQGKTHYRSNSYWHNRNLSKGPKHQKTIWPKNRDMKAQPLDEGGSDGGIAFAAPSGEGTVYDVQKLMGWNGDWMPADVDWAARKPFMNRNLNTHIDKWAEQVWQAYNPQVGNGPAKYFHGFVPITSLPYSELVAFKEGEPAVPAWVLGGDIALRQWIPTQIDGESPQQFWRTYPAQAPPPQSDIDLTESRPWWEDFHGEEHCQLLKLDVPEAPLDLNDPENHLPGRSTTANEALRRKAYAEKKRFDRRMEKRNGAINQAPPELVIPHNTLKPVANIYLRPVMADIDALPITNLYNHYIRTCVSTPEFKDRTVDQIYRRITDVVSRGLPWIVAVQKGKGKPRASHINGFGVENIVGFANLEDSCDPGSTYRFTFDLEMYVHHEYLHSGVGKCMMDQILSIVHPGYISKGGYEWRPQGDYLRHGCSRVVKVINFALPHAAGNGPQDDQEKVEWVTTFLKAFGFRKAGHFYGVGYKYGKCIDKTCFQTTTSETICADQPPMEPL